MTETLSRPDITPETDVPIPNTGELEEMFNAQNSEQDDATTENLDTREVSPTGSSLVRAANRINGILERRAVNKAHTEALKEYKGRDYDGYIDHLSGMTDSEDITPAARMNAESSLRRAEIVTDVKEFGEKAKNTLTRFGQTSLNRLKDAGLITLGASLAAGSSIQKGYQYTDTKFESGMSAVQNRRDQLIDSAKDYASQKIEDYTINRQTRRFNRESEAEMKVLRKHQEAKRKEFDTQAKLDSKVEAKQAKLDSKEAAREDKKFERSMRKKAALERKQARREKWTKRREGLKEYGGYVKEGLVETGDALKRGYATANDGFESAISWSQDKINNGKEAAKRKARIYHLAGHQAVITYRDAVEANKSR